MKLTQERVRQLFDYREDGALIAKERTKGRTFGKPVGSDNGRGYLRVKVDGTDFMVHRIVYLWHHGWMPEHVDHRDTNKRNNRIENLRPATKAQNSCNSGRRRDNSSGYKGVFWSAAANKWAAQISISGRRTHLGCFSTPELAHAAYVEAARKHFGEFARAA